MVSRVQTHSRVVGEHADSALPAQLHTPVDLQSDASAFLGKKHGLAGSGGRGYGHGREI